MTSADDNPQEEQTATSVDRRRSVQLTLDLVLFPLETPLGGKPSSIDGKPGTDENPDAAGTSADPAKVDAAEIKPPSQEASTSPIEPLDSAGHVQPPVPEMPAQPDDLGPEGEDADRGVPCETSGDHTDTDDQAAIRPCEQGSVDLKDDDIDGQVDPPSANLWTTVPTLELRGDDVRIETYASLIEHYPNDLKIYTAMLKLADEDQKGTRVDQDSWTMRIGYAEICEASECCKRALSRAWPRLERLGIVVLIEMHKDRRENLYLVHAPEWLERKCQESGCTHYRLLKEGLIQPFRPRAEGEK
jgi:hypothetical protein